MTAAVEKEEADPREKVMNIQQVEEKQLEVITSTHCIKFPNANKMCVWKGVELVTQSLDSLAFRLETLVIYKESIEPLSVSKERQNTHSTQGSEKMDTL